MALDLVDSQIRRDGAFQNLGREVGVVLMQKVSIVKADVGQEGGRCLCGVGRHHLLQLILRNARISQGIDVARAKSEEGTGDAEDGREGLLIERLGGVGVDDSKAGAGLRQRASKIHVGEQQIPYGDTAENSLLDEGGVEERDVARSRWEGHNKLAASFSESLAVLDSCEDYRLI